MSKESKEAEKIIRQYGQGLSTLDLELIAPILHPEFKFIYQYLRGGHGIRTDVRYIGHLFKTFVALKKEGKSIKVEYCTVVVENVKYLSILIPPLADRRIIYPMEEQLIESVRGFLPKGKALLFCKVQNGLLIKVECFTEQSDFDWLKCIIDFHSLSLPLNLN